MRTLYISARPRTFMREGLESHIDPYRKLWWDVQNITTTPIFRPLGISFLNFIDDVSFEEWSYD